MNGLGPEGPITQGVGRVLDLVVLNFWTVVCCIPLVTAGASLTAMHSMCLKMVRNEEGYITKGFFASFRENFKKATIVWLLLLGAVVFIGADYYAISHLDVWFADVARITLFLFATALVVTTSFLFPILARFRCTLGQLIANSFKAGLSQFPRAVVMWVMRLLPFVICYYINFLIPLLFIIAISGTGLVNAMLYNHFFERMEVPYKTSDDGETV